MHLASDSTRLKVSWYALPCSPSAPPPPSEDGDVCRAPAVRPYEPFLKIRSRVCLSSDFTEWAGPSCTMCKSEDEAPPRAAHRPPSSRFLTSSTALLPLGSSMLQLCRTRFVSLPTSSTRPSSFTAGSKLPSTDPPVPLSRLASNRLRVSRYAHTLRRIHPSFSTFTSPKLRRAAFTALVALSRLRTAGAGLLHLATQRAPPQGFHPRVGPNRIRLRIATGYRRFSSSMGFWFPFEAFVRLPLEPTHPCESRSRMLFAPACVCPAVDIPFRERMGASLGFSTSKNG